VKVGDLELDVEPEKDTYFAKASQVLKVLAGRA
jgi:hypothetical protein